MRAGARRCGVALALAVWAAPAAAQSNPDAVAVIIGNKTYAKGVPEVSFAHNDADAMKRFVLDALGYRNGNVIDLRDATKGQLETVFGSEGNPRGKVAAWVRPGRSDVLVFYSGHGVPGLKDRRGYLLPADADPDFAEVVGYPIDLLYANLAKTGAKSVTVFLESCFSGNSAGGALLRNMSPIFVATPQVDRAPKGFTVLTAAQGEQVASWDPEAEHGLFTRYLLEALEGAADAAPYGDGDKTVTVAEVEKYLADEMTYQARRRFNRDQTASVSGDKGAVLAAVREAQARPARDALAVAEDALGLTRADRIAIQRGLAALDLDAGPADGLFGPKTREALRTWQEAKGYPATGQLTKEQAAALVVAGLEVKVAAGPAPASPPAPPSQAPQARPAVGVFPGAPTAGTVFRDCPECPEMVVVPAGSFVMGSLPNEEGRDGDEGPRHPVTIARPFAVGKFEVTQAEWQAVMGANPSSFKGERNPVETVSWTGAKEFVRRLSARTGKSYRLLSEAEWEYAARARTTTPFHTGATITTDQANYDGNYTYAGGSKGTYRRRTIAVGSFAPNAFGLHDMHGNVWEWVEDCWTGSYADAPADGSAWISGECRWRVLRGGSWGNGPKYLRSAFHRRAGGGYTSDVTGFRVAQSF